MDCSRRTEYKYICYITDNRVDLEALHLALHLARDILNYVDSQVDARDKELRLIEIFNKLDARSSAMFKGKKFKKSDLLSNNRKLLHEGTIKWMSARGRAFGKWCFLLVSCEKN